MFSVCLASLKHYCKADLRLGSSRGFNNTGPRNYTIISFPPKYLQNCNQDLTLNLEYSLANFGRTIKFEMCQMRILVGVTVVCPSPVIIWSRFSN